MYNSKELEFSLLKFFDFYLENYCQFEGEQLPNG